MEERKNYAVITGASSGIGLAISRELARRGWPLLLVSNEEEKLLHAASEIKTEFNVNTLPLFMDLAQKESAKNLFNYCEANSIKIEILVNNAGIFFFKDITNTAAERMETMMNLHMLTPSMLCRFFAEQMIREKRSGYILNMASSAGWMMMPGIALYSATKSFLRCFSRAMRCETLDSGVSITTVCPGAVATGLYNLSARYMKLGICLGIIITPERLARNAIKKMFKKKAQFIPGGFINRFFIFLVNAMPEILVRRIKKALPF